MLLFSLLMISTKSSRVALCQLLLSSFALSCPAGLPENGVQESTVPPTNNYFGQRQEPHPGRLEQQGKLKTPDFERPAQPVMEPQKVAPPKVAPPKVVPPKVTHPSVTSHGNKSPSIEDPSSHKGQTGNSFVETQTITGEHTGGQPVGGQPEPSAPFHAPAIYLTTLIEDQTISGPFGGGHSTGGKPIGGKTRPPAYATLSGGAQPSGGQPIEEHNGSSAQTPSPTTTTPSLPTDLEILDFNTQPERPNNTFATWVVICNSGKDCCISNHLWSIYSLGRHKG